VEFDKIKKLMDNMGNSNLTEVEIDFPDGTKISMKKENKIERVELKAVCDSHTKEASTEDSSKVQEDNSNIVKSPMVGTFYLKPSPTSEPYVEVGKDVAKGDTLCIIEAMKLMNEIESEFSGRVLEVLVKDGEMVEYGTPLFKIS
jgi:acetyl-CoA carboxylase biotin carboxyl carrier protein